MKKLIITIAAIFISASFFSYCNKEQSIASDQPSGLKTYTLTISATKSPSTKALVLDSNTLNSVWGANDEVDVLYGEPKVKVGTLYPLSTGSETAVLSGTITASISPDDWIDLWYGGDLSNQDGSLASLNTNHYDRAKAWFQVDHIDGTTIVPQGSVVFNNWQAIVKFTVKKGDAALPVSKMLIKSSNGNLTGGSGQTLTITPSSDTSELFVALDNFDDDNNVNRLSDYEILVKTSNGWYSCNATNKTFQRGKYYDITLKVQSNTYTVAGTPAAAFSDKEWAATASENDLVYDSESGLYKKVLQNVPSWIEFKVVQDHSWDNPNWGDTSTSSGNYEAALYEGGIATIMFDPVTGAISVEKSDASYTVAGDGTVFGTNWDATDTNNDMSEIETGLYRKDITGVDKDYYIEFKVVANHRWGREWPSSNFNFTPQVDGNLYIFFKPSDNFVGALDSSTYTVAGDSRVFDTNWDTTNDNNLMSMQSNGIFTKTYSITEKKDDVQFKVVKNRDWNNGSWPERDGENDNNYTINIPSAGELAITFDPFAKVVSAVFTPGS